jgi:stage IV sporulation protein FB
MRDQTNWSLSLGVWGKLHVRLHIFFLLFAVVTLYLSCFDGVSPGVQGVDWLAGVSLLILLVSVLIHEFGHAFAARRLGGSIAETTLVPWGGIATIHPPRSARGEALVHLAGPAANALACILLTPLVFLIDEISPLALLHPLQPTNVAEGSILAATVKLSFWINWLLVIINLVPAYPFDGGRALRAGLSSRIGRHQAAIVVVAMSQLSAIALFVAAWFVRDWDGVGVVPVWFAFVLLGIFLLFSSKQEFPQRRGKSSAREDLPFGYDFSEGYTSLERAVANDDKPRQEKSRIIHWLEQRRQARMDRELEQEAEEERRVDEILARLHEVGMDSISEEDRILLDRVSARYRNRLGDRA